MIISFYNQAAFRQKMFAFEKYVLFCINIMTLEINIQCIIIQYDYTYSQLNLQTYDIIFGYKIWPDEYWSWRIHILQSSI